MGYYYAVIMNTILHSFGTFFTVVSGVVRLETHVACFPVFFRNVILCVD
jgi:hypothetical protein